MVTVDSYNREYDGLSTDTKPTDGVRNGEVFVEIDTGKVYLFDEEGQEWHEQPDSADGSEQSISG